MTNNHASPTTGNPAVKTAGAMETLMGMIGLHSVKRAVEALERRVRLLGPKEVKPGVYAFLGNPGTGKTMVAQLFGRILRDTGVLSQGHTVALSAHELAEDPGGLEQCVSSAKNGVLFIDDTSVLLSLPNAREAIRQLLMVLTNPEVAAYTCVILAGYPNEMMQLLRLDPGLSHFFGSGDRILLFEDYTAEEMLMLLEQTANHYRGTPLQPDKEYLRLSLQVFRGVTAKKDSNFGNARFVVNYLQNSVECLLKRACPRQPGEQLILTAADIPAQYHSLLSCGAKPCSGTEGQFVADTARKENANHDEQ